MSKITATQQFEAFNYHMRNVGFDTATKSGCLFNWTQRELNKWNNNDLQDIRHNIHEALREHKCSNKEMFEAVLARVNLVLTRRMLDGYDKRCEAKREEIKGRNYEQLIINGAKVTRLKENKITTR